VIGQDFNIRYLFGDAVCRLRPGLTLVRITRHSFDDFHELSSRYD